MRVPSSPSGGGSGGGGGDGGETSCSTHVDRSMTFCRPVDGRSARNPREAKGKRKSGRNLGAEKVMCARDDLNEAKTKLFIGERKGE